MKRAIDDLTHAPRPADSSDVDVTGLAVPIGVETVSYTHLRAHETVLDLVCRLLLEKKKTLTTIEDRDVTNNHTESTTTLQDL